MGLLNVRATIETNDGALIYVSYHGLTDLGEDAYDIAASYLSSDDGIDSLKMLESLLS